MGRLERRAIPAVRGTAVASRADAGGAEHIIGYGAVYYRNGDAGTEYELWPGVYERIMPGAFDRAIKEDDIRGLFNHDANMVLGRTPKTMTLASDSVGLRYDITTPDTQLGVDVIKLLNRGDVTGSSFAFSVESGGENWRIEDGKEIRELLALRLYDTGPVTYPAYKGTSAGVRCGSDLSMARQSFKEWHTELQSILDEIDDSGEMYGQGALYPQREAARRRLERANEIWRQRIRAKLERDMDNAIRG